MFFAKNDENAIPYFMLLSILTLDNIFKLKTCQLVHKILFSPHKVPTIFLDMIGIKKHKKTSKIHSYQTRYSCNCNLVRPVSRTNYGTSRFQSYACNIWESVPYDLKLLAFKSFSTQYKSHLLLNQN